MKEELDPSWDDVWWAWVKKGFPREEAAFQADEFMRRRERKRNFERFGPTNRKARRAALKESE